MDDFGVSKWFEGGYIDEINSLKNAVILSMEDRLLFLSSCPVLAKGTQLFYISKSINTAI